MDGDVALISGVRKHESRRRYERLDREGLQWDNGILWASPLVDFTDEDVAAYKRHHDIDENPVAALICASGECMCGAFEDREYLNEMESFFPEMAHKIYRLEWDVLSRAARGEIPEDYVLWGHGSLDAGEYAARTDVEQASLMCSDCVDSCPGKPYQMTGDPLSPAEEWLQKHDLSEYHQWPFYCAACDLVVEDPYEHRQEMHPFDADDDDPLTNAWDMRRIELGASDITGRIITEPHGWNLDPGHLTTDEDEAERRKHKYHHDETSLSHCRNHDHTWEPYNDGPVLQCTDCFAFDLSAYDPENPGEPAVETADPDAPMAFEDPDEIQSQLSEFKTATKQ